MFDAVFTHGSRFAYRGITSFILFRHALDTETAAHDPKLDKFRTSSPQTLFVGVTAKRRTRPAVVRNRIKRLLRVSVRNVAQRFLASITHHNNHIVSIVAIVLVCHIIPERPSLLRLSDIQPLVERIFHNAYRSLRSMSPSL